MTSKEDLAKIHYLNSSSPMSLFNELLADGAVFQPDNNNYGGYTVCRPRSPADLAIKVTIHQEAPPESLPSIAPIEDIKSN